MLRIAARGDAKQSTNLALVIAGGRERTVVQAPARLRLVIAGGRMEPKSNSHVIVIAGGWDLPVDHKTGSRGLGMIFAGNQPDLSVLSQPTPCSLTIVDTFSKDSSLSGTTSAVLLHHDPADQVWMQHVARQLNFRQTAFITKCHDSDRPFAFQIRSFSPSQEVLQPGTSALGASSVLFGRNPNMRTLYLVSRTGVITSRREGDTMSLSYGITPPTFIASKSIHDSFKAHLSAALLIPPEAIVGVAQTRFDIMVLCEDELAVHNAVPNFALLAGLPCRSFTVTALASSESKADVIVRHFTHEDEVTTEPSSYAYLLPYWTNQLQKRQLKFLLGQGVEHVLDAFVDGDTVKTAIVEGQARAVISGTFLVNNFLQAKL